MELIPGRRYLIGLPPWGIQTVIYRGPVPGWPAYARVANLFTGKVAWIRADRLKPLLVECGRDKAAGA